MNLKIMTIKKFNFFLFLYESYCKDCKENKFCFFPFFSTT